MLAALRAPATHSGILSLKPQKLSSEVKPKPKFTIRNIFKLIASKLRTPSAPPASNKVQLQDNEMKTELLEPTSCTPSAPPASDIQLLATTSCTPSAPPASDVQLPLPTLPVSSAPPLHNGIKEAKEEKYERIAELHNKVEEQKIDLSDVPDRCKCSISGEIMIDPVVAGDGFPYNRKDIQGWMETKTQECEKLNKPVVILSPQTLKPLPHTTLIPIEGCRADIIEYLQRKLKEKESQVSQLMRNRQDNPVFSAASRALKSQVSNKKEVSTHTPGNNLEKSKSKRLVTLQ